MKVVVFTELKWSLYRVYKDIAKYLPDYEFKFINWSSWDGEVMKTQFNECDVFITNFCALGVVDYLDHSKILSVSHGFEEMQGRNVNPTFTHAITSNSIRDFFPLDMKVFLTPNGVDPEQFDYKIRNGDLNTIGWCGATDVWYKQPAWAREIAKQSNTTFKVTSGIPCEDDFSKWTPLCYDEIRKWYSDIDLLLITSIPEAKHETGPLPAFEAIVSGVVVIGTAVGNFANVPGPKFTSIEEGIKLVNDLKSDPERMKTIAKEQYDYVMTNCTYASFAHKWREAFEYVCSLKDGSSV